MVYSEEQTSGKNRAKNIHLTKKCPECFTYLALSAKVCTYCHAKVGLVDKQGFAAKPFDWKGYLLAVVTVAGFVVFMWWAFFRE